MQHTMYYILCIVFHKLATAPLIICLEGGNGGSLLMEVRGGNIKHRDVARFEQRALFSTINYVCIRYMSNMYPTKIRDTVKKQIKFETVV